MPRRDTHYTQDYRNQPGGFDPHGYFQDLREHQKIWENHKQQHFSPSESVHVPRPDVAGKLPYLQSLEGVSARVVSSARSCALVCEDSTTGSRHAVRLSDPPKEEEIESASAHILGAILESREVT